MAQPRVLEPFGMILKYGVKDERKFDKDVIVKSATLVYNGPQGSYLIRNNQFRAFADFAVSRQMLDIPQNHQDPVWVRHATLRVVDGQIPAPTIQVEWHFKKNQPTNLLLSCSLNLEMSLKDLFEVHLTGVYVPDENNQETRLRLKGS